VIHYFVFSVSFVKEEYVSIKAKSRLVVSGPRKIPAGPKNESPPKTERSMNNGCILSFLPITFGPSILSINPTAVVPQIRSPIAGTVFPITKR